MAIPLRARTAPQHRPDAHPQARRRRRWAWSAWSGTSRRLFLAFGSLVLIFAAAAYFALAGMTRAEAGLARTRRYEEGVRLSLELASAVRDQYAHQAHTIIIGDQSHLGFYRQAEERVLALTGEVRRHAERPEEKEWVEEIEKASGELDQIFRERIVPAVVAGQRADVQAQHARAQLVVSRIQSRAELLVEDFEQAIDQLSDQLEAVRARTFRWILILLVGAPLLAAGVGITIGNSIARPVKRLQEGAARLAAGDLETRIEVEGADEFGALARQFNAMTAALREHQERLVQSEKLAGIGRLAAGVAHEINNPLGVILGYTRLLAKRAEGPLLEDLGVIESETLRCKEIVEGLLDLSRPMKVAPERVDLRRICDEVIERLRESRLLEGVEVTVRGSGEVEGQPLRLRQVVLNLVKNAAEAAGKGGRVEVQVRSEGGAVEVAVGDNGPGLREAEAEAQSRLFEPFYTTKPTGTGLGLAVSRAIAQAHGGDVSAGRSALGGALFTLRVPRALEERA